MFLSRVEASCKAIGYTGAAAKANRRKMYAMCDRHGVPSIFFSLTPSDEKTIRVLMWVCSGFHVEMPELNCSDENLIADFEIRRDARSMYPGACALEYQSIVQILLKCLFGWDSQRREGTGGILGTLVAWAVAHEEQGA